MTGMCDLKQVANARPSKVNISKIRSSGGATAKMSLGEPHVQSPEAHSGNSHKKIVVCFGEEELTNVVKLMRVKPRVLNVINFPSTIWWGPESSELTSLRVAQTHHSGWMGERSTPMTFADGNCIEKSIAQIPVPVARSRTL